MLPLTVAIAAAADVRLAEAELARGRPRAAAEAFRAALATDAADPRARLGLARALAVLGRCGEASPVFAELRGARGWGPKVLVAEGECHRRAGDPAAAAAAWEEAVALDPGQPAPWLQLLDLALDEGDDAAAERARSGLAELPAGPWLVAIAEARQAVLRRHASADALLAALGRLGADAPEVGRAHAVLDGIRWLQVGGCAPAADAFRRALELLPTDADAAAWRAEALRRCDEPEAAAAVLERPTLAGHDPTPLELEVRARLLADGGDAAGAAALRARSVDPEILDRWAR